MKKYSGLTLILALCLGISLGRAGTTGNDPLSQVFSWFTLACIAIAFFRQFKRDNA